jgi:hypothetical protein
MSFFENNPNSLIDLIGNIDENLFFDKVREQSMINFENGDEISLTRSQIIDIVVNLLKSNNVKLMENNIFKDTQVGKYCLN